MASVWEVGALEAHGGDVHRVELVADCEGLGLDLQPDVPGDWRESYSTEALGEIASALDACDYELFGQAVAGANAQLAADFH